MAVKDSALTHACTIFIIQNQQNLNVTLSVEITAIYTAFLLIYKTTINLESI